MEKNQLVMLASLYLEGEIYLFKALMKAMEKNSQTCKMLHPVIRIKPLLDAKHALTDEEKT